MQPASAHRLGIELLSSCGTMPNFITALAGRNRNPPRIVQIVACTSESLAKRMMAISGQPRSATLATQYGDMKLTQSDLSRARNLLVSHTGEYARISIPLLIQGGDTSPASLQEC